MYAWIVKQFGVYAHAPMCVRGRVLHTRMRAPMRECVRACVCVRACTNMCVPDSRQASLAQRCWHHVEHNIILRNKQTMHPGPRHAALPGRRAAT